MTAIASATTTLRVAAFVLNNDLRHPAVLAQDLASIDVLSGGRLDVALGAGWNRPEYDAIGLPFDATPVRQARLAESIAVLKGAVLAASRSASRASTTRSPTTRAASSRCSARTRRSSSAAAVGARSASPAARPTSSGSHRGSAAT